MGLPENLIKLPEGEDVDIKMAGMSFEMQQYERIECILKLKGEQWPGFFVQDGILAEDPRIGKPLAIRDAYGNNYVSEEAVERIEGNMIFLSGGNKLKVNGAEDGI